MNCVLRRWAVVCFYAINVSSMVHFFISGSQCTWHQWFTRPLVLLVSFVTLGLITSDFLTPSLSVISNEILHVSDRVAGLTLLSLGNDIPEITTTYQSMSLGVPLLALGELLGGVLFLLTVVIGLMGMIHPIHFTLSGCEEEESILRYRGLACDRANYVHDLIMFTIMILMFMGTILCNGALTRMNCLFFIGLYLTYMAYLVLYYKDCSTVGTHTRAAEATPTDSVAALPVTDNIMRFDEGELSRRLLIRDGIRECMLANYRNGWTKMTLAGYLDIWRNEQLFEDDYEGDEEMSRPSSKYGALQRSSSLQDEGTTATGAMRFPTAVSRQSISFERLPTFGPSGVMSEVVSVQSAPRLFSPVTTGPYTSLSSVVGCVESKSTARNAYYVPEMLRCLYAVSESTSSAWEYLLIVITAPVSIVLGMLIPSSGQGSRTGTFLTGIQACVSPLVAWCLVIESVVLNWGVCLFMFATLCVCLVNRGAPYRMVCAYEFATSVSLISATVRAVVGILRLWSREFSIRESILGATVFAWGGSIGDLVANLTFVKIGVVEIALGACFGSPLLSLLFGVGVDGLVLMARENWQRIDIAVDASLKVTSLGVLCSLLVFLVVVPLNGWVIDWKVSAVLFTVYTGVTCANVYLGCL
ncbi:Ycx1p KNAG_0A02420 [Huiozyma naganishii CBS 8797]|uniref:Sodium/calcium exchanger membrane region domain-containing protein n=1 Tax=Huiozyma naganishii (strain ATCC MYA-139 / BCRC 22969 / CBS 8797 / KCTC 17520 / NBRC 10181 / NCYC 3082 / Yp74L-3) TaxID=1071383 RepID=J7S3D3_HUIN7|nr:hypothetical protein KNAG_0A02420 [Kazachstania naganishii CBS 8797]CCK67931.1 hypothetical protein KNAG_0A02420 [Kazachstania naganishii CBS 8797]